VAFVDIGLPGLDGYAVAQRLRMLPRGDQLFLVALTGYGQPEDRRRAEDAGFDAHVVKPVDLQALDRILDASAHRAGHGGGISGAA
jgi:CheY-like chemotaxis protein